ncbi:rhodanese-like domain-containing protein [Streptomyces beihaiensis]|uniref:Rhodanese-like domain-containing protein n=1 Tax=Streptomyces beihaiensis TaxID=2984495 RepID=A0ABT3TU44_9ACTN|nr:rhodanese-like domain-containing protein [Streptomyces beihaiensis]MCX3060046.1 rhodanese-like domain-containing protein [Streptomyces beihaiensis]
MTTPLTVDELKHRLGLLTVIDVRSPGEYSGGHIPGAHNIPLDKLAEAVPALKAAAAKAELAVVCASGNRSTTACRQLADAQVAAFNLTGGTQAWLDGGHPLDRPAAGRAVWAMDRQVRFAAGTLVLAGVLADLALPGVRWVSAAVGAGLAFSALTNTCAMGMMLGKLPHNRPKSQLPSLDDTLTTLGR